MSKKKNYNKMYDSENQQVTPEEIIEPVVEEDSEIVEAAQEVVTGTVVNCNKLNVREQMHTRATVLCVLPAASEVKVIVNEVHNEWYHIFTETGIEGFCMKKYIQI